MSATTSALDVVIRPYKVADAPAVYEAVRESMRELQPWMPWCHPAYSLSESRAWLETQVRAFGQRTAFEFAIVSHEGRYLGGCGLNQIDEGNRRANLGYWVRSSSAGRGVAARAVLAVRDWGFHNTDLIRLEIVIAAGNVRSQRVAIKTGAAFEGTLRDRLLLYGVAHHAVMFSFTRDMPPSGE